MRYAWLVALLLIPLASAQYPSQPGNPDYSDGDTHIQDGCILELDWTDRQGPVVEYSYESICDGLIQDVEYVFRANDDPGFVLAAEMVGSMGDSGGIHGVVANLDLIEIVEFADDGDGKFTPDEDTVVRRDGFAAQDWSSVSTSDGDGTIFFSASYALDWGATFEIQVTTSGATFDAGGITVRPADAKIDFLFHDATYTDPGTRYAIVMEVEAAIESIGSNAQQHIQKQEQGVQMGGATGMYFTWAKTADVDGEARKVGGWNNVDSSVESIGGSIYEYEGEGTITLAYPQGQEIVHDPRFGVALAQPADKDSPLPVLPLVVALLGLAFWRRR